MGACQCGYTTDAEKNCNGTYKVIAAVKADIARAAKKLGVTEAVLLDALGITARP